jgi:hypothetical protein
MDRDFGTLLRTAGAAGALALVGATQASADTLSWSGFNIFSLDSSVVINAGPNPGIFQAGEIQLTTASGTVDVWCVDITRGIPGAAAYTVEPSSYLMTNTPPGLDSGQVGQVGALIAHAPDLIGGTDGAAAEAIQLAIWGV